MLHFWLLLLLLFCAARRMAIKLWANMNNPLMMINYVENFILTNLCKLIVAGYEWCRCHYYYYCHYHTQNNLFILNMFVCFWFLHVSSAVNFWKISWQQTKAQENPLTMFMFYQHFHRYHRRGGRCLNITQVIWEHNMLLRITSFWVRCLKSHLLWNIYI